MYNEHSTSSSVDFLNKSVLNCPFAIREIQTDNGNERTRALEAMTERQHRIDEKDFPAKSECAV